MIGTLLDGFKPATDTEARHLTDMRVLAQSVGSRARDHFVPGHFTASAFVLSPDGSALLLIHHAKLGRWLQPGGHVEPEDDGLLSAARREVAEEVGLTQVTLLEPSPFDLDIHVIPARKTEPEHKHFDVRFLFRSPTDAVEVGDGVLDVRWVPLGEVSEVESDASVMRAVEKLQAHRG